MDDLQAACHDCGVKPGEAHDDGCDVARCLWTGQQRLACQGFGPLLGQEAHDCGQDVWTGEWPGDTECRKYGLWCYCPPVGSPVPCGPDHPEAIADTTALIRNGRWDREAKQWVLLDSPVR